MDNSKTEATKSEPPKSEPSKKNYKCDVCLGTGRDAIKTDAEYRRGMTSGYIACRPCMGNGLDPAKFFRCSAPNESALNGALKN